MRQKPSKKKTRRFTPALPNELQIDADRWPRRLTEILDHMVRVDFTELREVHITPSKTAGHWHVRVLLKVNLAATERVTLQAILGSDPHRELLNLCRVRNGAPHPILFLED